MAAVPVPITANQTEMLSASARARSRIASQSPARKAIAADVVTIKADHALRQYCSYGAGRHPVAQPYEDGHQQEPPGQLRLQAHGQSDPVHERPIISP